MLVRAHHLHVCVPSTVVLIIILSCLRGNFEDDLAEGIQISLDQINSWPPTACMMPGSLPIFCIHSDIVSGQLVSTMMNCEWNAVDIEIVFDFFMAYESVVNGSRMTGPLPYDDIVDDYSRFRAPPLSICASDTWSAYAIGPFETAGGYFWPSTVAVFKNSSKWLPPQALPQLYAFQAYYLGSIDLESRIVGYPPIHQHHFHFGYVQAGRTLAVPREYGNFLAQHGLGVVAPSELMGNHGEDQCHQHESGPRCTIRSAPDGFAYHQQSPLAFVNTFNDVRPLHSRPFRTWQVVAVKHDTQHARGCMALTYLATLKPTLTRFTYALRALRDAVSWSAVELEFEHIFEASMHGHASSLLDIWWFHGPDGSVFDDLNEMEASRKQLDYSNRVISRTMSNIKSRQLKPGAATLSCAYRTHSTSESIHTGGSLLVYVRKIHCPVVFLSRHQVLVVFHRGQSSATTTSQIVRMHAFVRIFHGLPNNSSS